MFLENEVDGDTLAECESPDDLNELGITFMPKCRAFFNKLQEYKARGGVSERDVTRTTCSTDKSDTCPGSSNAGGERVDAKEGVQECPVILSAASRFNSIVVSGIKGDLAPFINGVYDPTDSTQSGFTVYRLKGQEVYLEYNEMRRHWHVKPGKHLDTTHAWMYVPSPCVVPHSAITSSAHVWNHDTNTFSVQDSVRFAPFCPPVMIAGCTGIVANQVNGVFDPTEEQCG
jgi:hypothetical protein